MPSTYAQGTTVPVSRSIEELRILLAKHGADGFATAEEREPPRAMIGFRFGARSVRIELPLPSVTDREVARTRQGVARTPAQAQDALAQEHRRRWRALLLVVKAKLEAVANGISTLEREFLADLILPNGRPLHVELAPRLAAWESGQVVPLIPERLT